MLSYIPSCKKRDRSHPLKMDQLTVLYNDKCPVCSFEIEHYRALCMKHGIDLAFEKISENGPMLQASGLSVTDAKKRLHVRTRWASEGGCRRISRTLGTNANLQISRASGFNSWDLSFGSRGIQPPSRTTLFWWDKRRVKCDESACG